MFSRHILDAQKESEEMRKINLEKLLSIEKDDFFDYSKELDLNDLDVLVDWLSEKNDKIRYQSFLLLQERMKYANDVYPYWEEFRKKLRSENSYQRSIGLMMIAGNVKWDKDNKFEEMLDEFCSLLNDEKPITVRQCIQSFREIVPYTTKLNLCIAQALMNINIPILKETMRKLILFDIVSVLLLICNYMKTEEIDNYISNALMGELLDKKMKQTIESML